MTSTRITETDFQGHVVELAGICGWRHLHVRRTIGRGRKWVTATNLIGWPDLLLMCPVRGWVAAELKVPPNKATPEQLELLEFLATMPGCRAFLWTPNDWPAIETTLARRAR